MTWIMVDIEADGPIPGDYSMVCLGAIAVEPAVDRTFYGGPRGRGQRACRALTGIARVRNRIAHGHASVDHARMWSELPSGLDALDPFSRRVAASLPQP